MGRIITWGALLALLSTGCGYAAGLKKGYDQGFDAAVDSAPFVACEQFKWDGSPEIHLICVTKDGEEFNLIRIRQPKGGV